MARGKKNMPAPSAIAVIYARYSSHAQKDVSIEQQVAECEEYAAANNLEVVNIYSDRHLTGRSDRRPEFQKMMRHAEKQQFQVIICGNPIAWPETCFRPYNMKTSYQSLGFG